MNGNSTSVALPLITSDLTATTDGLKVNSPQLFLCPRAIQVSYWLSLYYFWLETLKQTLDRTWLRLPFPVGYVRLMLTGQSGALRVKTVTCGITVTVQILACPLLAGWHQTPWFGFARSVIKKTSPTTPSTTLRCTWQLATHLTAYQTLNFLQHVFHPASTLRFYPRLTVPLNKLSLLTPVHPALCPTLV